MFKINGEISETILRGYGFTDLNPKSWYLLIKLHDTISFNLTIPKNDYTKFKIDVLDEDFLEPYDFENIKTDYAKIVGEKYKEVLSKLIKENVLIED